MTTSIDIVRKNKLFKGLKQKEIERITPYFKLELFKRGDVIIRKDDKERKVFLIVKGNAQVQIADMDGKTVPLKILKPRDFFGEMSFFSKDAKRTASVVAISDMAVITLEEESFDKITQEHPAVMKNILVNAINQLQDSNRRVLEKIEVEREILEQRIKERTLKLHEKNRLLEEKNSIIHRQLMLAQSIQKKFLPPERFNLPGLNLETLYIPCEELGGDICGYVEYDGNVTAIYAGDVSGHGVSSALVTIYLKQLIDNIAVTETKYGHRQPRQPGEVLTKLNSSFMQDINDGNPELYFTIFYLLYDRREPSISYSSAGIHCPPLFISKKDVSLLFDLSDHPIGFVEDNIYETSRKTVNRGDSLLFVSDGVVEAYNGKENFGTERLMSYVEEMLKSSGRIRLADINLKVEEFSGSNRHKDDMCYLLMDFV